jgi:hypothetical protein
MVAHGRGSFEGEQFVRWIVLRRRSRSSPRGLAVSFRVRCDRPVSRAIGCAIPLRRSRKGRPCGLPYRSSRADGFNIRQRTSHRVPPPFRVLHGRRLSPSRDGNPFWTFGPYGTCGMRGPVLTGIALPVTFRPQGLSTLSTACSLARLAGLVSCRQRLWDFPFGAFSSFEVARRFRRRAPRLPWPRIPPSRANPTGPDSKLGFRVLPRASPLSRRGCLARRAPEAPLGFLPLRDLQRRS